jgi:ribosome-binding factor A
VGKNITARLTPSIEFIADGIPENAALIESLLTEARNRDAESESLAKTAQYAGDEDPYVKPRVYSEDEDDLDDDGVEDDDDAVFEAGPRP